MTTKRDGRGKTITRIGHLRNNTYNIKNQIVKSNTKK